MDLNFDDETLAFQAEVRDFLAANRESFPTKSYDTAEGFAQHRRWDKVLFDAGLSVITWPEKYGGRDATAVAVGGLRGGVLPRRRARPGQRQRHLDAGADAVRARHRGAAGPGPAEDGQRRRDLGAGLVRTRVRQRPGVAALAPRPRPTAAGCSTARRSGVRGRRSATGRSGCSAPTRRPQRHNGPDLLHVRPRRPTASRCGRSRSSAATPASARSSSTTSSCPTTT